MIGLWVVSLPRIDQWMVSPPSIGLWMGFPPMIGPGFFFFYLYQGATKHKILPCLHFLNKISKLLGETQICISPQVALKPLKK